MALTDTAFHLRATDLDIPPCRIVNQPAVYVDSEGPTDGIAPLRIAGDIRALVLGSLFDPFPVIALAEELGLICEPVAGEVQRYLEASSPEVPRLSGTKTQLTWQLVQKLLCYNISR